MIKNDQGKEGLVKDFIKIPTEDIIKRGERRKVTYICFFFPLKNLAIPFIDILLDSVAPEVNTISFGLAPIKSATCYIYKKN